MKVTLKFATSLQLRTSETFAASRFMLSNKRLVSDDVTGETRSWHMFYAWSGGQLPGYLASKSGKYVIAIAFLHYINIQSCTLTYSDNEELE